MGNENQKDIDPSRIKFHGKDLEHTVVPKIDHAGNLLSEPGTYNLEGGDFSVLCILASVSYPMAVQFAFEDLKAQKRVAEAYVKRIHKTAQTYDEANVKSSLRRP